MEPKLVSIGDACIMLGVGRSTIYRMISMNEVEAIKLGRRRLLTVEGLNKLIESKK